jgi:enoyl-CoA hydratase
MTDARVDVQRDPPFIVLSLNRPAIHNAIDLPTAEAIAAFLDELDGVDAFRVGVITGAGGTFCAGMDLGAYHRGEPDPYVPGRGFGGIVESPPAKPLIAAVEGYALAGGFEVVLCCDLVVAGEGASFGIPEVRRGLVAAGGGLLRLRERIPYQQALALALLGDTISAGRAHELGLVQEVVPDGRALAAALVLAQRIASNAPLAVATSKRILADSADWPREEWFARQEAYVGPVLASADAREGAAAFTAKRPPVWTGR